MGEAKSSSIGDGINQIGSSHQDCSGGNHSRTGIKPNSSAGKIIERLEFIENAYSTYLEGRQQHLETSLIETKEQKELFNNAVQELKREIRDLVSAEEHIPESK
ncbi:hypothetical protein [Fortiea contorta]|uniref:hypothetical protein n=1 Tax=Fortiea contorta TaxID=1892405 RepID=UPI0012B66037|nr:hypothetical protein [Fortiea contorta]